MISLLEIEITRTKDAHRPNFVVYILKGDFTKELTGGAARVRELGKAAYYEYLLKGGNGWRAGLTRFLVRTLVLTLSHFSVFLHIKLPLAFAVINR